MSNENTIQSSRPAGFTFAFNLGQSHPTQPGYIDGRGSDQTLDPRLTAPRSQAAVAASPLQHLHDGLENFSNDGRNITANPDTQMVRTVDAQGNVTYLIPTYRTALVYDQNNVPIQQMTTIEVHPDPNGLPTAVDSISRQSVPITQDPQTHHFLFSDCDGQQFDVDPDSMNVFIDGREVHLQPDDPDPMQALEVGRSIIGRGVLQDGNLVHKLSDGSEVTYNPSLHILRLDHPDGTDGVMDGTVDFFIPGADMGSNTGGVFLRWTAAQGLVATDPTTHQTVPSKAIGNPSQPDLRFLFMGSDGRAYSLDPDHLDLGLVPAHPPS